MAILQRTATATGKPANGETIIGRSGKAFEPGRSKLRHVNRDDRDWKHGDGHVFRVRVTNPIRDNETEHEMFLTIEEVKELATLAGLV